MILIEEIKRVLGGKMHMGNDDFCFLALALASACSSDYKVPIVRIYGTLGKEHIDLVRRLLLMCYEPDFSNADQADALSWLRENGWIK